MPGEMARCRSEEWAIDAVDDRQNGLPSKRPISGGWMTPDWTSFLCSRESGFRFIRNRHVWLTELLLHEVVNRHTTL